MLAGSGVLMELLHDCRTVCSLLLEQCGDGGLIYGIAMILKLQRSDT